MCTKTNTDTGIEVAMVDVYTEFSEKIVEKYRIGKFKTRVRCHKDFITTLWKTSLLACCNIVSKAVWQRSELA